ncbi:hypothetical protein ACF0H5_002168 [Mactra antiquata]
MGNESVAVRVKHKEFNANKATGRRKEIVQKKDSKRLNKRIYTTDIFRVIRHTRFKDKHIVSLWQTVDGFGVYYGFLYC